MISQIASVKEKPVEQEIKVHEPKVSQETPTAVQSETAAKPKEQPEPADDEAVVYQPAQKITDIEKPASGDKTQNTENVQNISAAEEADETNADMDLNSDGVVTVYEMMEYLKSQLKGTSAEDSGKVSLVDASNAVNAFNKYRINS